MTNKMIKSNWGTELVYDPEQKDWILVPFWFDEDDDTED